jgi:hypothetical protein
MQEKEMNGMNAIDSRISNFIFSTPLFSVPLCLCGSKGIHGSKGICGSKGRLS